MEASQCLGGRKWSEDFMSSATSKSNVCSLASTGTMKPRKIQGLTLLALAHVGYP